jgi:hypothetical protein
MTYDLHNRRYEMLHDAYAFLMEHIDLFSKQALTRDLIARIGSGIDELSSLEVAQMSGISSSRSNTKDKKRSRAGLREYLDIMAQTAV